VCLCGPLKVYVCVSSNPVDRDSRPISGSPHSLFPMGGLLTILSKKCTRTGNLHTSSSPPWVRALRGTPQRR
jgi:hypothetical protein